MREKFFFLLSGEHESIPASELKSVLKLLDPGAGIQETGSGRIILAETSEEAAREAVRRTAYTKLCGRFAGISETSPEAILSLISEEAVKRLIPPTASTMAVRGKRIMGASIDRLKLERMIGERILEMRPGLKVDLRKPDILILFISSPVETVVGSLVEIKPKRFFHERLAGRRPFSLPSAMQPDLSRAMINLAGIGSGGLILDPFAGTGGIMIEGILLGYRVYGIELKRWIAEGALRNLKHYALGEENIIVGDARKPMFRDKAFNAIVTDPPYGRSTTIPDKSIIALLDNFLEGCLGLLKDGGRIVMAVPAELSLEELIEKHGLRLKESHIVHVHGSLVRKVVVLER
ncbi:MAG: THUMP domain-containing protein [Thaumarchaeota archaeon]|nr:THUMP domain-containing protein [Nitrososphaerota archaeon]MCL7385936.1 THUMP domain-containing protein [Candidatus Wolframiiraptor allenii]